MAGRTRAATAAKRQQLVNAAVPDRFHNAHPYRRTYRVRFPLPRRNDNFRHDRPHSIRLLRHSGAICFRSIEANAAMSELGMKNAGAMLEAIDRRFDICWGNSFPA
jgi:hypothetical protein